LQTAVSADVSSILGTAFVNIATKLCFRDSITQALIPNAEIGGNFHRFECEKGVRVRKQSRVPAEKKVILRLNPYQMITNLESDVLLDYPKREYFLPGGF
jgi:hypothetical protein